ncbi:MAG: AAA family ATPase [Candidatus Bruticola sp.]
MKIHKLIIENINCIVGKWEIDFDNSDFAGQKIFAVTGPVGSGKSTVLDSICLALYGETSRCAPNTKCGTENVVNIKQNIGRAEIMFTVDDTTYISSWSQKKNGTVNMSLKKRSKDSSEFVLESDKVTGTKSRIEKIFGMKFKQFTQAILLAQGEFRRFFSASAKERAELLGNITGKLLYQKLPAEADKKFKEIKQQVEELERQSNDPNMLNEEVWRENQDKINTCQARNNELEEQLNIWAEQLKVVSTCKDARNNLLKAEADLRSCQIIRQEAAPQFVLLEMAERADRAKVEYSQYVDSKKRLEQCKGVYLDCQNKMEIKEAEYRQAVKNEQICESYKRLWHDSFLQVKQICTVSADEARTLESLRQESAASLQRKIKLENINQNNSKSINESNLKIERLRSDLREEAHQLYNVICSVDRQAALFLQQEEDNLQNIESEIEKHSRLGQMKAAELDSFLQGQTEAQFLSRENGLLQAKENWNELQSEFSRLVELIGQIRQVSSDLADNKCACDAKLEQKLQQQKILEQKRAELNAAVLRWEKARDIDELAKYRHFLLERGGACPLCGAEEHPYLANSKFDEQYRADLECAAEQKYQLEQTVQNIESLCQELARQVDLFEAARGNLLSNFKEKSRTVQAYISKLSRIMENTSELCSAWKELQKAVVNLAQGVSSDICKLESSQVGLLCKAADDCGKQVGNKVTQANQMWQSFSENRHKLAILKDEKSQLDSIVFTYKENLGKRRNLKSRVGEMLHRLQEKYSQYESIMETETASSTCKSAEVVDNSTEELDGATIAESLSECLRQLDQFETIRCQCNDQVLNLKHDIIRCEENIRQNNEDMAVIEDSLNRINSQGFELSDKLKAELDKLVVVWSESCSKSGLNENLPQLESKVSQAVFTSVLDKFSSQKDYFESQFNESRYKLSKSEAEMKRAQDNLQEAERSCQEAEYQKQVKFSTFEDKLSELGFDNEAVWQNSRLADEVQISELHHRLQEIDSKLIKAQANWEMASHKSQQADMAVKNIDDSPEALENKIAEGKREAKQIQQEIGAISLVLELHDKAKTKKMSLAGELNRANKELAKWKLLCNVLGSINGNDLNKFVQSLTFRILLAKTNERLQDFTDRYELQVQADNSIAEEQSSEEGQIYDQSLDFEVIDKYQSAVRGSGNLSGGESFLVSLSMALALSDLASTRRDLNSLFLDEGFGTLDSETLSVVLSALDKLGSSDKMIGLVSHVAEVKDNIAVQLELERSGDGTSRLVGHNMKVCLLHSADSVDKKARSSSKKRK